MKTEKSALTHKFLKDPVIYKVIMYQVNINFGFFVLKLNVAYILSNTQNSVVVLTEIKVLSKPLKNVLMQQFGCMFWQIIFESHLQSQPFNL